jgi:DNA-binding beta-propeller fold protein YncE
MTIVRFAAAALVALVLAPADPQASELMTLEGKIPLGAVKGRIDHLAVDLGRNRLFVAELGNDSLGIVDLAKRTVAKRIGNLKEPQGVAYVRSADLIYVTNAGDGSVEIIKASNFSPAGERKLGDDADNIRVDPRSRQVFVGYGSGGLAVLDAASGRKTADIPLAAHPESFQLGTRGDRIFVNLPDARHIAVIARATGREIARWGLPDAAGNFAMALGEGGRRLLV